MRVQHLTVATPATGEKPLCVRLNTALQLLGISKTKMYELIAAGEIDAIKIGRATMVLGASLEAFVARAPRL